MSSDRGFDVNLGGFLSLDTFRELPCQLTLPGALAKTQEASICPQEPQTAVTHFPRVELVPSEPSSDCPSAPPDPPTLCYRFLPGRAEVRGEHKAPSERRNSGKNESGDLRPTVPCSWHQLLGPGQAPPLCFSVPGTEPEALALSHISSQFYFLF